MIIVQNKESHIIVYREIPPSLHANEVMMAESDDDGADQEVEEMDTKTSLPSCDVTSAMNTGTVFVVFGR